jgi:hypothetical protein
MAGLLILAHRLAPSPGWRTFLEIGVVVVGYGSMALWLGAPPDVLLGESSVDADNPTVRSSEWETPTPLASSTRCQFCIDSDPAIIYDEPDCLTGGLRSNGHPLVRTLPPSLEEADE